MDQYNENAEQLGAIGFMRCSNGNCYISAAIGVPTFTRLLQCGKLPNRISVHAQGLEYGSGSRIVLKALNEASVVAEVSFTVPLVEEVKVATEAAADASSREFSRKVLTPLYVVAIAVVLIAAKVLLG